MAAPHLRITGLSSAAEPDAVMNFERSHGTVRSPSAYASHLPRDRAENACIDGAIACDALPAWPGMRVPYVQQRAA